MLSMTNTTRSIHLIGHKLVYYKTMYIILPQERPSHQAKDIVLEI